MLYIDKLWLENSQALAYRQLLHAPSHVKLSHTCADLALGTTQAETSESSSDRFDDTVHQLSSMRIQDDVTVCLLLPGLPCAKRNVSIRAMSTLILLVSSDGLLYFADWYFLSATSF